MITFKDITLAPEIQKTLEELGFIEPTEIQEKAIPLLLSSDKIDFHGQAQTGTGKTLAFAIPLLHRINTAKKITQALIVAPTRELALQIRDSINPIAKSLPISVEAIYGGFSLEEQIRTLKRGVQIIVGTPGRLNDHLRRRTLSLSNISTLVLDEADIMLDMGFKEEIEEILTYAPKNRAIWLFSATVKSGISELMQQHMSEPISIQISKKHITASSTKQYFSLVPMRSRLQALCRFIESSADFYGFIFCQTKILTSEVAEALIKRGYKASALHGDMSQVQRNLVIIKFKQKEITIVVATDIAARGIDIANLSHVINYSLPEDLESYVHRIGRTGRAGKEGIAITFINKRELQAIQYIQRKFNSTIQPLDVPSHEMLVNVRLAEISRYLTSTVDEVVFAQEACLDKLVNVLSHQQIKILIMRLLHDKFLSTLESDDSNFISVNSLNISDQVQELYINVGSDDGINRDDILAYLTKTGYVKRDQIQKIRVIKRRTFVELPSLHAPKIISALQGSMLGGRRAHISFVMADRDRRI